MPVDLGMLMTGIKGTIATAQKAYELSKAMQNIELKQVIMELSQELLDVQMKVIELREETMTLREELKTLKDAKATDQPTLIGTVYKFKDDEHDYCVGCWDSKGKKSKVIDSPMRGVLQCYSCNSLFRM